MIAKEQRLQLLDRVIFSVSVATIFLVIVCGLAKRCGTPLLLPGWITQWMLPLLTAGAVGYLTNYVAIWLLFRPYKPVRWLGNLQGDVSREQATLAKRLGEEIPRNLLPPEELSIQLGCMVSSYLRNPELIADIRGKVNYFLARHKAEIAAAILPHVETAIRSAIREKITPENLQTFFDMVTKNWLDQAATRERLVSIFVAELKERTPEMTASIRSFIRSGTQSYVREEYPTLSSWFNADDFAAKLVTKLNWTLIQEKMSTALAAPKTRTSITEELLSLFERLRNYIHSPDMASDLEREISEWSEKGRDMLKKWLKENLAGMLNEHLSKDELWETVETRMLPAIQAFVIHKLKKDNVAIVESMNFSGRIESAIMNWKAEEIHALVNRISGEHLVRLQLLGYVLGIGAGFFLALAQ